MTDHVDFEVQEQAAQLLRQLGWTVEPPERPQAAEQEDVPYVAIGAGERPPWHHLDLNCPTCGEGPLPLRASEPGPGDSSGIVLHFISHCGGTWMRGPIT